MAISDLVFIDTEGFHYPDFPAVLDDLKSEYRGIYGLDTYLESDSQDGQWVGILALAIFDTMHVAAAVYNSFSPLTAQSDALTRNVKINGIRRLVATFSQVDLTIVGQPGTTITNGIAEDTLGQKWNLPASVIIPSGGSIIATALAQNIGTVSADANTITKISTPTRGWQTVNNVLAVVPGAPVEPDAVLRKRQTVSTALPSTSIFDGTIGAVANISGVLRYFGYENDGNTTDSNGIPAHTISIVVEGGDSQAIGEAIAMHKTPGTGTYGTTNITTIDQYGIPNVINFYRPTVVTIGVQIELFALPGYTSGFEDLIAIAIADYINNQQIGDDIILTRLFSPAILPGNNGLTYEILQISIKKNSGSFDISNIVLAFNEVAICDPELNVSFIVT